MEFGESPRSVCRNLLNFFMAWISFNAFSPWSCRSVTAPNRQALAVFFRFMSPLGPGSAGLYIYALFIGSGEIMS